MATVKIPPVLRAQTGGQAEVSASGSTVGEVLAALVAEHPDTERQLFAAEGELNRYVNVYVNDEDVRVLDGLDTAVSDGDTVAAGDTVVVLEAMKMEQPITAHKAGTITGLTAAVGQTVSAGATLCEIKDA